MENNLPCEVLELVAFYTKKSFECLLVSRKWYNSFIPTLYRNVDISTRWQWTSFFHSIEQNKQLGFHVKSLHIHDNVGLSHQEIESLSIMFPFLVALYFNPNLWKYQRRDKLDLTQHKWNRLISLPPLDCYTKTVPLLQNYGQHLQSISLSGNLVHSLHRVKLPKDSSMLIDLFHMTPQLRNITLYGRDDNNPTTLQRDRRISFSLPDIQKIHDLLPSLESLELFDVALSSPLELDPTVVDIHQCSKLKKFYLEGAMAHYIWLYYISELYPNLVDLSLNITSFTQRLSSQDKHMAKQGFERIASTCKHLQRVNLGQVETSLGLQNTQFFAHLSIQHGLVSVQDTTKNERTYFGKSALENFSSLIACTKPNVTETLRIHLWRDLCNVKHVMKKIGLVRKLSVLELSCGKFSYNWTFGCDIGTIAKYCPHLKTLVLKKACLTSSQNQVALTQIETVKLHQTHFTTDSMQMLAACCPDLKHLELIDCVKDRDQLDQKVYIHFPSHHLESLTIEKLYLRPNKYTKKSGIDIAFLATNYTERSRRLLERKSNQFNTRWYHLYCQKNKRNTGHSQKLKYLKPYEYFQVESYEMRHKDWNLLEENTVRRMYRESNFWSSDIPYGYLYINCKYIDNLKFNDVKL